jgi:hypothetical protein
MARPHWRQYIGEIYGRTFDCEQSSARAITRGSGRSSHNCARDRLEELYRILTSKIMLTMAFGDASFPMRVRAGQTKAVVSNTQISDLSIRPRNQAEEASHVEV